MPEDNIKQIDFEEINKTAISQPLVSHIYTADPSAHVFDGKIYIYPSHDIDAEIPFNDNGDHFGMEDYHVLSMDNVDAVTVDNGVALHVKDVLWAERQMWAPDAAHKNGNYYLYFPAKRANDIFQIGVAISDSPTGPFTPEPEAIKGSYTIDPAIYEDEDGKYYMYFGGIWGGQLQKYRNNQYSEANEEPLANEPALGPIVALLSDDMKQLAEEPKEIQILDENGANLLAGDNDRRFFEASWVHKYKGKYYFSYSTGDTHLICYATGDSPYGPFTYQGIILEPVVGWTSHHSICEVEGKWYLFYHDSSLSKGVTHLRSVKVTEIKYNEDGSIVTINPYNNMKI
ncbi:family 43 glycosylhydrolase [Flavobacterium franklandianum]|uniref:Alpha-N-arabinofuranosidase n=1 Tax=Flavobacterium bomense TaxID=2497483 RepID=A0A3S0NUJ7_9FLAO|nr:MULTISPECIES: glycoside hydrolase family 43 protein [Flavobacterium]RTY97479.1 alpha-N-arabinofuranosidase [Flavobacterium bomense]TRX22576.1 family 43 glycosylhydrolase [Flavobacterium franklandianum]